MYNRCYPEVTLSLSTTLKSLCLSPLPWSHPVSFHYPEVTLISIDLKSPSSPLTCPYLFYSCRVQSPKELIEDYFKLLTQGCGNGHCNNQYCASSPQFCKRTAMSPNEAAIEAIRLVKEVSKLLHLLLHPLCVQKYILYFFFLFMAISNECSRSQTSLLNIREFSVVIKWWMLSS